MVDLQAVNTSQKKALKAVNQKASDEQIKQLIKFGLQDYNLKVLSSEQASYLLKELKRDKKGTLERIRTLQA